jgi:tRNA pseudouridine38/39 synthase
VEEELWKALVRCRLIFPGSLGANGLLEGDVGRRLETYTPGMTPVDWEGCEYSKCGRTDKGVSAFGQVVGVQVRSARKKKVAQNGEVVGGEKEGEQEREMGVDVEEDESFDPINDELPYVNMLNRALPSTIRILAWCPSLAANWDARFSCKEREYRYFFTSPAFLPVPGVKSRTLSRKLDLDAMREAASYLVGTHDFRNMCKLDGSKQLTEFSRRIDGATLEFVSYLPHPHLMSTVANDTERNDQIALYAFRIVGSAFLWHQVRCMVAILFLVGQGLELPTLIKDLLDVEKCPSKPMYEMASDRPLVLWDCKFSAVHGKLDENTVSDRPHWDRGTGEDELEWIYAGESDQRSAETKWGRSGIMESVWKTWRGVKMEEILASQLMERVAQNGGQLDPDFAYLDVDNQASVRLFAGDDTALSKGKYVPVMQRPRMEPCELVNARWASRKRGRESE